MPVFSIRWMRRVYNMALFFCVTAASGQKPYFQQVVNYTISVSLNDSEHTLKGAETLVYVNNSGDTLRFIWFHLWPNAYSNRHTALSKQLVQHGKSSLHFAPPEKRGYIDSLSFRVAGNELRLEWHPQYSDVAKVHLHEALAPGDTVTMSTPFFVKIPDADFSRLGHSGQAYYITQWYPKPAVYDRSGWHPMPYLDQGEFYSEFGSFDVSISLPENYLLAATGNRIASGSEDRFLAEQEALTRKLLNGGAGEVRGPEPQDSNTVKTVRFVQKNVHDFAWFADKRFGVLHDTLALPGSARVIEAWVFFTPQNRHVWKNALQYVKDAGRFYSAHVGEYPYEHITAVDGTIMAGGGMEYPNITVIGEVSDPVDLDLVITHEIGHNWFYGILGSNERDHPFLDEGLNSYYEMRYTRMKYPMLTMNHYLGRRNSSRLLGFHRVPYWKNHELMYRMALTQRLDQSLLEPSTAFSEFGYSAIVYSKSAVMVDYLAAYLGQPVFDSAMQHYYRSHRFRHPAPDDLVEAFASVAGHDRAQVLKRLLASASAEGYKIKQKRTSPVGTELTIKSEGQHALPFNLFLYRADTLTDTMWFAGFKGRRKVRVPGTADRIRLDGNDQLPDLNRANNVSDQARFLRMRPLSFTFLTNVNDDAKTQLHYLPALGANYYNGLMAGIVLHNHSVFRRKLQFYAVPLFSFRNKRIAGLADVNYSFFPQKIIHAVTVGFRAKTFGYDEYSLGEAGMEGSRRTVLDYIKLSPAITLEFRKRPGSQQPRQTLAFRSVQLLTDSAGHTGGPVAGSAIGTSALLHELSYHADATNAIKSMVVDFVLQQSASMMKASVGVKYELSVAKNREFEWRLFAGSFIYGTEAARRYYAFRAAGYSGEDDYLFDHYFFARNLNTGVASQQFAPADGSFKTGTTLGRSPGWLLALNMRTPRFFRIPLRVFADAAACDKDYLAGNVLIWNAGLNITLWKNVVEVYVPLLYSAAVKEDLAARGLGFSQRIRFTVNIHKFEPEKIIRDNLY